MVWPRLTGICVAFRLATVVQWRSRSRALHTHTHTHTHTQHTHIHTNPQQTQKSMSAQKHERRSLKTHPLWNRRRQRLVWIRNSFDYNHHTTQQKYTCFEKENAHNTPTDNTDKTMRMFKDKQSQRELRSTKVGSQDAHSKYGTDITA